MVALRKLVTARLDKELRKEYGRKSVPVRKGDTVEVMVGKFKKTRGIVTEVDIKKSRLYIEGVVTKKRNGAQVQVPVHAPNVRIVKFGAEDKKRQKMFQRARKEAAK